MDLTKFYDYVGFDKLITDAELLGYPLDLLLLSIEQYLVSRYLSTYGALSNPVAIGNSVVAGCGRAVSLIRCFLYRSCSELHTCFPKVGLREFVDDLHVCAVSNTARGACHLLSSAGTCLLLSLTEAGCKISPKTVVLATTNSMRAQVCTAFKRIGFCYQSAKTARDLGVDTAAGRKRTMTIQRTRHGKARLRSNKVRRLAKLAG